MSEQRLINLDDAIEIIETKQRELCPMGRCSRQYVSGTDRERFDEYEEMIEALCVIPTVDAAPVLHGHWIEKGQEIYCSVCDEESAYTSAGASRFSHYCPSCGAKMDEEN